MPHLRLEYSSNIKEDLDPKALFSVCHQIIVETFKADLATCQSRAIAYDVFHVGKGGIEDAFIYLEILPLEGRSLEQVQDAAQQILKVLETYFARSLKELNVKMAVHVTELSRPHYFKSPSKATG
jgi:5-carboxymethyl-2-hydroxymuconate isomerase